MTAEDVLRDLELPATVIGCQVDRGPGPAFEIESKGPLGSDQGTLFLAQGNTARIVAVGKKGRLGSRRLDTPIERHVEVLREIGFVRMILPSGKEYEISEGWPGVKRVRK